jgi:succinate dehydrogenase flavin-adding protein (antitoxin of CptAB toxin-antitoxin module)
VLFDRFLKSDYSSLSDAEQADFQRLLDEQDPIIMDWLLARYDSQDQGLANIIEKLKKLSGL